MAVNEERGEIAIRLAGREMAMRPTYEALAKIERDTGRKTVALAGALQMHDFGVQDIALIITHGLQAADEAGANLEAVGNWVMEVGLTSPDVLGPINDFFVVALGGKSALKDEGPGKDPTEGETETSPSEDS